MSSSKDTASTNTCFGIYENTKKTESEKAADLSLDFIVPLELISHWKKCSLVADFIANYQAYNFVNPQKAMSVLSTITNELLENAIKFTADKNKLVSISLRRFDNTISIETVNMAIKDNVDRLKNYIHKIENEDLDDLFINTIESSEDESNSSGLGLITVIKDYDAKLGIKVEEKNKDELYNVFVQVSLTAEQLNSF